MTTSIVLNHVIAQAAVLGMFGGVGLALTAAYSRRGPLIYPVYAVILAALAVLLTRYASLSFWERGGAALVGFSLASAGLYIATGVLARGSRRRLVRQGRLPASALAYRVSLSGHVWRIAVLLALGTVASAGVAFLST